MVATRLKPLPILSALMALAVGLLSALPAQAGSRWGADYFPNVPLITQDGKEVHFYDDLLKGKAVAINVIYTHCEDECPLETAKMLQLQRLLGEHVGKDIFFYSISIDPVRDTPAVLKTYAKNFRIGPGWLFLTGKESDIKLLTKKLGLTKDSDFQSRDGHDALLLLGNEPGGQWMQNSASDNPKFLAATIRNFLGWQDPTPARSYAQARPLSTGKGEYVFGALCSACHTIGKGDRIGPDLFGVTTRRDRAWLEGFLAAPEKMLAAGDPLAVALFNKYGKLRMPNLNLGPDDRADLLDYLAAFNSVPLAGAK